MRRNSLIAVLATVLGTWLALVAVEYYYREPPNYTLIETKLYLGEYVNAPPPGTTAVLNLCESEDPYECAVQSWQAIRDAGPAPSLDWLAEQVAFIDQQRQAGRTTYVHCHAGVSRSVMVVAAYLMRKHDWTRDEALARLREKRPQVRPNLAFMDLLAEWERKSCTAGRAIPQTK